MLQYEQVDTSIGLESVIELIDIQSVDSVKKHYSFIHCVLNRFYMIDLHSTYFPPFFEFLLERLSYRYASLRPKKT